MKKGMVLLVMLAGLQAQAFGSFGDVLKCNVDGGSKVAMKIFENKPIKGQAVLVFANGYKEVASFTEKSTQDEGGCFVVTKVEKEYSSPQIHLNLQAIWSEGQGQPNTRCAGSTNFTGYLGSYKGHDITCGYQLN